MPNRIDVSSAALAWTQAMAMTDGMNSTQWDLTRSTWGTDDVTGNLCLSIFGISPINEYYRFITPFIQHGSTISAIRLSQKTTSYGESNNFDAFGAPGLTSSAANTRIAKLELLYTNAIALSFAFDNAINVAGTFTMPVMSGATPKIFYTVNWYVYKTNSITADIIAIAHLWLATIGNDGKTYGPLWFTFTANTPYDDWTGGNVTNNLYCVDTLASTLFVKFQRDFNLWIGRDKIMRGRLLPGLVMPDSNGTMDRACERLIVAFRALGSYATIVSDKDVEMEIANGVIRRWTGPTRS